MGCCCRKATGDAAKPLPGQVAVAKFYNSTPTQVGVALIIGLNFLTNIVEKQIDPFGDLHDGVFGALGLAYNIIFTIELAFNMYGHWCKPFWSSGWNIFDVIVVAIGVINTLNLPLPSAFSLLRMMRAFRVFRLFKRVASLNKIIVAIARAVPGVLNAFLILAIVMSIYAILAVEFYQNVGEDCNNLTSNDRWYRTVRGRCHGEEYFGKFSKSLYSFFQVMTGESWSEAVARPCIWYFIESPLHAVGGALFFVSYVIITAFVLGNVVVAVLLDKMIDPDTAGEATEIEREADESSEGVTKELAIDASPIPIEALVAIDLQIEKLATFSITARGNLDTARKEMVALGGQIDAILQIIQKENSS